MGSPPRQFGPYRLDVADASLWRDTERLRVTPKALAVLACLVDRAQALVTKEELLEAVWPETAVVEAVLTTTVREIRQVLGDRARDPRYVETVHGRGYRFIAPVEVHRPDAPPTGGAALAERTTLVGRDRELDHLKRGFHETSAARRSTIFVAGEAGIGKTTLVDAFVEAVRVTTPRSLVARGQCIEQHGAGEPYLPLLEALGRLGRRAPRLVEVMKRHAPSWLVHLPALVDEAPPPRQAPSTRMLRELAEAIEVFTQDDRLVLVLEDLHWSDASTLQWIAYAARRRDPARLLLICTYRPVDAIARGHGLRSVVAELRSHPQASEIVLDFLSPAALRQLVRRRYGHLAEADPLASVLHDRTRGHPLFVATILDALESGRMLATDDGDQWRLETELDAVEALVPDTIRAHIERRLDLFDDAERAALEAAAAAGVRPHLAAVAAALQTTEAALDAMIASSLARGDVLEDDGTETWPDGTHTQRLRFRHALYQQVLYQRTPAGRRARLHSAIGRRIEQGYGARADACAAALAVHFEAAGEYRRAALHRAAAARVARRRSAYAEAHVHVGHGWTSLDRTPAGRPRDEVELALRLEAGTIAMITEGWGASTVDAAFERALELARALGDDVQLMRSLFGALGFRLVRGQYEAHSRLSEAMREAAERLGDRPSKVAAEVELAGAAFARGDLASAETHFSLAMDEYEATEHLAHLERFGVDFGVFGWAWWSHLSWHRGLFDRAERQSEEALRLARATDHPATRVVALSYAALLQQYLGRSARARAYAENALHLSTEHGLPYYEAWSSIVVAWSRAVEGDRSAAVAIRAPIEALMRGGARRLLPYFLSVYAERCIEAGDRAEAERALDRAVAISEETGEAPWAPELHRLRGRLLQDGPPERARAAFARARALANDQGADALAERARRSAASAEG